MSRHDRLLRGGLLAALLVSAMLARSPAFAAPADALMPIEKYTTDKARTLANAHRVRLLEFSEQIYNCMPWLAVYPGRLGFPKYKDSVDDDRYLSTWIYVDQRDDPGFAALPQERRVSAMFSRYGVDMLRRMAALTDVVNDFYGRRGARFLCSFTSVCAPDPTVTRGATISTRKMPMRSRGRARIRSGSR